MAKKDTINALVRRGLDRDSAEKLADNGFLLNDVQTASKEELMEVLSDEEANEVIEELQEEDEEGEEEGQYGGKDWESSYESEEELFSEKDESVNAGGDVGERLDNEEIKKWEEKLGEKRAFLYIMLVFFFSLFIGFGFFDPLPAFLIAFFGSGTFWSYIVFYKKPKLRKEYLDNPKHQSHIDFHTLKKMFSYEDFDEDAQERMVEKKIKRLIEEEKLQGEYNEITRTYNPPSVMGQGKNYDEKKDSVTTGIKKSKKKEKGIVEENKGEVVETLKNSYNEIREGYKKLSDDEKAPIKVISVILVVLILIFVVYISIPPSTEDKILDAADNNVSTLDDAYSDYITWFPSVGVVEDESYYDEEDKFAYILLEITYYPDGPQSIDTSTRDNFINAAAMGAFAPVSEDELERVDIDFGVRDTFRSDEEIEVYIPDEGTISAEEAEEYEYDRLGLTGICLLSIIFIGGFGLLFLTANAIGKEDNSDSTSPSSDSYDVDSKDYGIDCEGRDSDKAQNIYDEDDEVEPLDIDWD